MVKYSARFAVFVLLFALAYTVITFTQVSSADTGTRFYANTGFSVSGAFLRHFDANGGVRIFGFPVSNQLAEDGRTVQYFERARFEHHPEHSGTGNEVQLTRLGSQLASSSYINRLQPAAIGPNARYVRETGRYLASPFLDFWNARGGLRVFGYPISNPVVEKGRVVQYFERARMEKASGVPYGVQLGLVGLEYIRQRPALQAHIESTSERISPTSRGATTSAGTQRSPADLNTFENQLFAMINDARRNAGVAPVTLHGTVRGISLFRSQDMAAKQYFSHDAPDGTSYMTLLKRNGTSFKFCGEILAMNKFGDADTARAAFNSFMKSPAHHAIMLDPRFNQAGIGAVRDGKGLMYYTVIFIQQ